MGPRTNCVIITYEGKAMQNAEWLNICRIGPYKRGSVAWWTNDQAIAHFIKSIIYFSFLQDKTRLWSHQTLKISRKSNIGPEDFVLEF